MQSSLDGQLEERLLTIAREFSDAGMSPLDVALQMTQVATSAVLEGHYRRVRSLLLEARSAILEAQQIEDMALQRLEEQVRAQAA